MEQKEIKIKIFVKAKLRAKKEKIEKIDLPAEDLLARRSFSEGGAKAGETHFVVWVKEPPQKGKANQAIAKKLAEYFKVSQSQIVLRAGFSSKNKVFEISK